MISYFYPPQPMRIWPNSNLFNLLNTDPNWDCEIKYNGWRLLIFIDKDIKFFNRHGTEIQIDKRPFRQYFEHIPCGTVFDGELVHFRTTDVKNTIILWDSPFYNNKDLRKQPLTERRKYLSSFKVAPYNITLNQSIKIYRTQQFPSQFIKLYYDIVNKNNDLEEGIVLKKKQSFYDSHQKKGPEIKFWIKIKKIGNYAKV